MYLGFILKHPVFFWFNIKMFVLNACALMG